jgi:hypothetical protein
MDLGMTAMERALELAESGSFVTTGEIRSTVIREGYGAMPGNLLMMKSLRQAMLAASRAVECVRQDTSPPRSVDSDG